MRVSSRATAKDVPAARDGVCAALARPLAWADEGRRRAGSLPRWPSPSHSRIFMILLRSALKLSWSVSASERALSGCPGRPPVQPPPNESSSSDLAAELRCALAAAAAVSSCSAAALRSAASSLSDLGRSATGRPKSCRAPTALPSGRRRSRSPRLPRCACSTMESQSEAIKCNQRQSEAIKCNHACSTMESQSEAIKCNHVQSRLLDDGVAIRGNQVQSSAISMQSHLLDDGVAHVADVHHEGLVDHRLAHL